MEEKEFYEKEELEKDIASVKENAELLKRCTTLLEKIEEFKKD